MAKVTNSIPSFTGGISTQPSEYRSPDQVEDMLNCYPSLAVGAARRPPFLGDTVFNDGRPDDKSAYHIIPGINASDPDDFDIAVVRANEDGVRVYGRDGTVRGVVGGFGDVESIFLGDEALTVFQGFDQTRSGSAVPLTGKRYDVRASLSFTAKSPLWLRVTVGMTLLSADLSQSQELSLLPGQGSLAHVIEPHLAGNPQVIELVEIDYASALSGFTEFTPAIMRLSLRAETLDSTPRAITFSNHVVDPALTFGITGYVLSDNPRRDLRFLTVKDRTHIVNTSVVVKPSDVLSADRGNELLIVANADPSYNSLTRVAHVHEGTEDSEGAQEGWAKSWYIGHYTSTASEQEAGADGVGDADGGAARMWQRMLTHDVSVSSSNPGSGVVSSERPSSGPLKSLPADGFTQSAPPEYGLTWVPQYTYQYRGRTLYIHKPALASRTETENDPFFGIEVWSSSPDFFTVVDSRGARSVDLPTVGFPGMVVHINRESTASGDSGAALDTYFVRFATNESLSQSISDGALSTGAWEETVGPGVSRGLADETMPVSLLRSGEDYLLGGTSWTPRTAGNTITAPDPSFVGNRIGGLAYFGGRLVFLSQGSVSLSSQEDNFSFYPSSVLANLASDPIDLRSEVAGEEPFHAALPVSGSLLIFGRTQQFLLSAREGALTAETAVLRPVTEYSSSSAVTPAVYGNSILFAAELGEFSAINLATISAQFVTENVGVSLLTGHIPTLIPSVLSGIVASATFGFAAAYEGLGRRMWVWNEYVAPDGRVAQRAWSRWTLDVPWKIALAQIINDRLWLVYTDPDDSGVTHDRLVSLSLYDGVRGLVDAPDGYHDVTAPSDIDTRMVMSPLIPRDENNVQLLDAEVSLSSLHLSVFNTQRTEVLGEEYDFDTPTSRVLTAPIRGSARETRIELVNDGPNPSSWVAASWSGSYTPR